MIQKSKSEQFKLAKYFSPHFDGYTDTANMAVLLHMCGLTMIVIILSANVAQSLVWE